MGNNAKYAIIITIIVVLGLFGSAVLKKSNKEEKPEVPLEEKIHTLEDSDMDVCTDQRLLINKIIADYDFFNGWIYTADQKPVWIGDEVKKILKDYDPKVHDMMFECPSGGRYLLYQGFKPLCTVHNKKFIERHHLLDDLN